MPIRNEGGVMMAKKYVITFNAACMFGQVERKRSGSIPYEFDTRAEAEVALTNSLRLHPLRVCTPEQIDYQVVEVSE
jgi:hypothetical protein